MRQISKTSPAKNAIGAGPRKAKVTAGLDEKRERILLVAEELFARNGYANTTMDQIVRQLGVTKPFVYYYFKSKQEIFEVLSWKPTVECFTTMDFQEDDVRPAHEKIMDGLERLIRSTLQYYPAAFFPYREPQAYRPEYRAAQKQLANHFYDRMCSLLEQGRKDGTLDFTETKITALAGKATRTPTNPNNTSNAHPSTQPKKNTHPARSSRRRRPRPPRRSAGRTPPCTRACSACFVQGIN